MRYKRGKRKKAGSEKSGKKEATEVEHTVIV